MPTRAKRPATFTCEYCGYEKTEPHGLGPRPRYCAACKAAARRSLNRQRLKAHREGRRQLAKTHDTFAPDPLSFYG